MLADYVVPIIFDPRPGLRALSLAGALGLIAALVIVAVPMARLVGRGRSRFDLHQGRTIARTGRAGRLLIGVQAGLSLVLVAHAGLLVRTLHQLRAVDTGVRMSGVTVAYPFPLPGGYRHLDNDRYYPELAKRLKAIAGVTDAGFSGLKPLSGGWEFPVSSAGADTVKASFNAVSPGFFNVLGIRLLNGRLFTWDDNSHAPAVAVVSQRLARALFADDSALGRIVSINPRFTSLQVVGVIADARASDLKDSNLRALYIPSLQLDNPRETNYKAILLRGSPSVREIDRAVESLGHEAVADASSLQYVANRAIVQERMAAEVGGLFGGLALLLCGIGLYGLIAYTVAQRSREIAIRMALGAEHRRIVSGIVREGLLIAAAGILCGLPIAWGTVTLLRALLYDVSPHDPFTLGTSVVLLLLVAVLGSYGPARRAARVDPVRALSSE